jgi:hypothetical protein
MTRRKENSRPYWDSNSDGSSSSPQPVNNNFLDFIFDNLVYFKIPLFCKYLVTSFEALVAGDNNLDTIRNFLELQSLQYQLQVPLNHWAL